jgi:hypothetical protein
MTVVQGQTAYYTFSVTPQGASAGTIQFACGTLPANALCVFNPAQLTGLPADVSGNVIVGIAAGAPAAAWSGGLRWRTAGLLLCGLLGLPFSRRRKTWRMLNNLRLTLLLCAGLVCGVTSCAGSGGSGGTGGSTHSGGGTPAGSYPVIVTAASDGVSKSVKLTLVVN